MTGFVMPAQVAGAAAGWTLADWQQLRLSATADATGTATITCPQLDPAVQWLVDRVVVQSTSSATTTARLYDSIVAATQLLDGTGSGNLNTADYPQGMLVRPSSTLVVQWTGATPGATCTLTAQVRVYR